MPTIISEPEIKPRNSNSDSGMDYYKHFDSVVKPKNYSVSVPDIDSYLGKDLTIHNTLTVMWTDYRFYCSKLWFFFQRHKLENLKQMLTWGICFRM